ncbi:MAG: exosome complex protein Rrp42 [Nanoarchaeota archaeon]
MSAMEMTNVTKQFFKRAFSEDKRYDGRKLLDLNSVEIEYGVSNKAEGSARVKLGKTEVIAGVKMAISEPYPDSQDKGSLIVSGDLLPLASPRFELGPPGFDGIEIPRLVDRMIRESGMIDFKKLCIKEGEKVWTVFIDVYPINDDGSLLDAAGIAAVAALKNATMPELDESGVIDYGVKTKEKLPISKETLPLSLTFYKLGNSILLHPTREEQEACDTKVTFGGSHWNGTLMLNSCQKGWETTFTADEINHMMDVFPKKYEELHKKVMGALK